MTDLYHDPVQILAEVNRIRAVGIDSDPEAPLHENAGYLFRVIESLIVLAARSSAPTDEQFKAAATQELNCPRCGERSTVAESELRRMFAVPSHACDCITSGNTLKPKQHGADLHAKNCAIYGAKKS